MGPFKNDVTQKFGVGASPPLLTPCVSFLSLLLSPLVQSLSVTFSKSRFSLAKKRSTQTTFPKF